MKKTAFLLVLALLLQILLPPSMAGNVYAASTEEVAQTQAADGDQLKSLYETYYLGACKKTGDPRILCRARRRMHVKQRLAGKNMRSAR